MARNRRHRAHMSCRRRIAACRYRRSATRLPRRAPRPLSRAAASSKRRRRAARRWGDSSRRIRCASLRSRGRARPGTRRSAAARPDLTADAARRCGFPDSCEGRTKWRSWRGQRLRTAVASRELRDRGARFRRRGRAGRRDAGRPTRPVGRGGGRPASWRSVRPRRSRDAIVGASTTPAPGAVAARGATSWTRISRRAPSRRRCGQCTTRRSPRGTEARSDLRARRSTSWASTRTTATRRRRLMRDGVLSRRSRKSGSGASSTGRGSRAGASVACCAGRHHGRDVDHVAVSRDPARAPARKAWYTIAHRPDTRLVRTGCGIAGGRRSDAARSPSARRAADDCPACITSSTIARIWRARSSCRRSPTPPAAPSTGSATS